MTFFPGWRIAGLFYLYSLLTEEQPQTTLQQRPYIDHEKLHINIAGEPTPTTLQQTPCIGRGKLHTKYCW